MGKKANETEINFNYPIPRQLHREVKQLQLDTGMKVKEIVINALEQYVDQFKNK